ncbi:MAG: LysM peptidoglycan-binding domain-containing protein, partial [Patescibacteria group bacterium]
MDFKRFSVKIIAGLVRGFSSVAMRILARFDFIPRTFVSVGKGLFGIFVFPAYRLFYVIKYKAFNVYSPAKSKVFYFLNKSYLAHVLIIVIGFAVMINGLSAEELRSEGFGEQTIIYSVVSKEILEELTEEYQSSFSADKILSYLDKSAVMESQKGIIDYGSDLPEEMVTEFSSTTEGGAAVVKPNIIQPIKLENIGAMPTSVKGIFVYTVQAGETISAIADKFKVSVETILWQNNLTAKSMIKAGMQLEILPVAGVVHKVKNGENIGSIAKKYNVSQDKIISANNLFDVND